MKPNDRFDPFSNGTEYHLWLERNCEGCRKYNPEATSSKNGCPMEVAIAIDGFLGNGITAKHGLRCGLCVAGPNGEIVRVEPGVIPTCPERRGRDERDDDRPG